jgi:formylglycine-generating enzyme required for sulfatase activity
MRKAMVWIPGGTFTMGSNDFYPEEKPVHRVTVAGFWMDQFTVTNIEFKGFVDATHYVTVAERTPQLADYPGASSELLVAGSIVFHKTRTPVALDDWRQWWRYVPGACWRHPRGPGSDLKGLGRHPVVHVAYEDVEAYAAWVGKEIPSEPEWEYAARGGLDGKTYCWGDDFEPDGRPMANTWYGEFPYQRLPRTGFEGTAPVGSFPPNGYGLHDMAGNVWEWTSDWFARDHASTLNQSCCSPVDPRTASLDPAQPDVHIPRRVLKGGSYLCSPNYCFRYRPSARSPQQQDSGTCHIGFRLISREP